MNENPLEKKVIYQGSIEMIDSCPYCKEYFGKNIDKCDVYQVDDGIHCIKCGRCNNTFLIKDFYKMRQRSMNYEYNPGESSEYIYERNKSDAEDADDESTISGDIQ